MKTKRIAKRDLPKRKPTRRGLTCESLENRNLLAVLPVTTLADSNSINSLRGAIAAASTNPNAPDTIDIQVSGNIALTLGQIVINKSLTIEGLGSNVTTITAAPNSRVFSILEQPSNNLNVSFDVTIEDVTLTGGNTSEDGGAILTAESLTLTRSIVSNNSADSGGGIAFSFLAESTVTDPPSLTITDSEIRDNDASSSGGGIFFTGDFAGNLTIVNSLISGNDAVTNGGGLAVPYASNTAINNTEITGNTAGSDGGGVFLYGGSSSRTTTITDSTVSGNSSDRNGGGVYVDASLSNLAVSRSTISGNFAADEGGGVFSNSLGLTHISESRISGNSAGDGGGIRTSTYSENVRIESSTVSGNSSSNNGGGVHSESYSLLIFQSTISGNSAVRDGGGIYVSSTDGQDEPRIQQSTITSNFANSNGGGIHVDNLANLTASNTIFAGNTSSFGAADVYATMINSTYNLIGDTTSAGGLVDGVNGNHVGVADITSVLDPVLTNVGGTTLTHALVAGSPAVDAGDPSFLGPPFDQRGTGFDRVVDGNGDGSSRVDIGAVEGASRILVDTVLDVVNASDNRTSLREAVNAANATSRPDAIQFDVSLANETFQLNSPLVLNEDISIDAIDLPGGVTLDGGSSTRLFTNTAGTNATLRGLVLQNGSSVSGGAVHNSGILNVSFGAFRDNRATGSGSNGEGGAILSTATGELQVSLSEFSGNSAVNGGAIMTRSKTLVVNSTFSGNEATMFGGGIHAAAGTIQVDHNTITENTGSGFYAAGSVVPDLNYNIIANNDAQSIDLDVFATVDATSSFNLISVDSGLNGISDSANGNQIGTAGSPVDAQLMPLGDNGGRTRTHVLGSDSSALNAGPSGFVTSLPVDQRGGSYVRIAEGGSIDLGAVEDPLPEVLSVKVGSSVGSATDWSQGFLDFVDPVDGLGYSIPIGISQGQLRPLPWQNIQQLFIEFNEDVGNVPKSQVALFGVNNENYVDALANPRIETVEYDHTTRVATITLSAPLKTDKLLLRIFGIQDTSNELNPLQGEIVEGFRFDTHPGDTDQSGGVSVQDVGPLRNGLGTSIGDDRYSIFADLNASGVLAVNELGPIRTNLGTSLPAGEPNEAPAVPLEIEIPKDVDARIRREVAIDIALASFGKQDLRDERIEGFAFVV